MGDQFDKFAKNYRVVCYDIRAHGRSPMPAEKYSLVEDLTALLKFLKIDKAAIAGLSLGGVIAADFALEHPKMVEKLVLVGSGLRGFNSKPDPEGEKIFVATQKAAPEKAAEMWLEHALLAGVKNRQRERKKMLQLMIENHRAYTQIDAAKTYILPQPPTYERFKNITAPTLVIIGDLDFSGLIEVSHALKTTSQTHSFKQ